MPPEKEPARILVVDDDKHLADNLAEYLAKLGYRVVAAYGGPDALDRFRDGDFHLVVTDFMMPDIDGISLLERMKGINREVIVILITGYGTVDSAVRALKKGAHDFIQKPFKMEKLGKIIARALAEQETNSTHESGVE
ncbi:MAG: response regulator [Deltaproteobacteria bacterium]|nr:response regulator [Deltaproteobacteria bacterium]